MLGFIVLFHVPKNPQNQINIPSHPHIYKQNLTEICEGLNGKQKIYFLLKSGKKQSIILLLSFSRGGGGGGGGGGVGESNWESPFISFAMRPLVNGQWELCCITTS